jgi:lysophospholipase L1-like esterase
MSTEARKQPEPEARVERARGRRRAIAIGAVALLSLVGNVIGVEAGLRLYAREQEVRLDPLGLRVHAAERASANAPRTKPLLAMFGDSRVAMWKTPSALTNWDVVNLGIGYQTTAQALPRFDYDVAPLHPAVVVFEIGVNDLKDLSMFPERRDEIVRACEENIAAMVAKARGIGARVVLATVFDLGDAAIWRRPFWTPAPVAAAIMEVNAFLRTLANGDVVLFETAPVLDDVAGKVRASYQVDHLHIVPAGYDALNEKLVSIVRAFPPSPR